MRRVYERLNLGHRGESTIERQLQGWEGGGIPAPVPVSEFGKTLSRSCESPDPSPGQ